MKRLEKDIGMPLFSRTRPTIQLTPSGEALYFHTLRIFEELHTLERKLRNIAGDAYQRPLTIGAGMLCGDYVFPSLLQELKASMPNMKVIIEVEHAEVLLDRLRRSEVDFAIMIDEGIPSDFIVESLASCDLLAVMSPQHPFATKESLSEQDLLSLRWILPMSGKSTTRMLIDKWSRARNLNLNIVNEIRHFEATKQLVKTGIGESLLFLPVVLDEIKQGVLVAIGVESPPQGIISVVRIKDKLSNIELNAINIVKRRLQNVTNSLR